MQRIFGFDYDKIHAELKDRYKNKKIKAKSNLNIKSVTQEKLDFIPKNNIALKFKFEFTVDYTPNIANILFTGYVLGEFDNAKGKEILKKWKSKNVPDNIKIPLFNFILRKCSMRALRFEDEFGLPSHIPLPRITQKGAGNTNYTG